MSDLPFAPLKSTAGLKLMLFAMRRMSAEGTIASECVGCAARSWVMVFALSALIQPLLDVVAAVHGEQAEVGFDPQRRTAHTPGSPTTAAKVKNSPSAKWVWAW